MFADRHHHPRRTGVRSGYTLVEVMITASLAVIVSTIFMGLTISVAKWYQSAEAKTDFAAQISLLDMRIRPDCTGTAFYEVYDDYPTADGAGGVKLSPNTTRGGNLVVLAQVSYDQPLSTNPTVHRIVGYYADTTVSEINAGAKPAAVHLRRFDSGDPDARGKLTGKTDLVTWLNKFPATVNFANPNTTLGELLPPASQKNAWPIIAKLDIGGIRLAAKSRTDGTIDPVTGLPNQIFYPRDGILLMNLPIRYGTKAEAYIVPLTLSFHVHQ